MRRGIWAGLVLGIGFMGGLCRKPTEPPPEIITELPGVYNLRKRCGVEDSLIPPDFGRCIAKVWRPPHMYMLLSKSTFLMSGLAFGIYRYTVVRDSVVRVVEETRVYPFEDTTVYINFFDVSPNEQKLAVTVGQLNTWNDDWWGEAPLKIVVVDLNTQTIDTLPSKCAHMLDPRFSEDGRWLYVYGRTLCEDGTTEGVWAWDVEAGQYVGRLPLMQGEWGWTTAYAGYWVERDTAWSSWGCVETYALPSINPWDSARMVMTKCFGGSCSTPLLVWERWEGKVYEVAIPKSVFFPYNLDKWDSSFLFPFWLDETTLVVTHVINGGAEGGAMVNGVWVIERPRRFYREVRSCSSR